MCCAMPSHSIESDSLQPHGLQPTRLLCPWDSQGKNTGVGYHFHKCEKTLNSVCSSCSHPRQMLQPHIQVQYSRYKLKGCFYFMPCLLPKYRPKLRMEMFQNQVRATMQMQSLLLWVSSHSSSHSISFLPPSLLCTKSALYKSCEMLKNICCTYEH